MNSIERRRERDRVRYRIPERKKEIIESNKNLRDNRKKLLVEMLGGACSICGYDRCIGALEFHHKDPTTKSFCLNKRNMGKAWQTLLEEAEKCILVCANCHRELEESIRLDERLPC